MSATGRGSVYRPLADYYTDPELAGAIVGLVAPHARPGDTWVEPHVGGGSFLRALYAHGLVQASPPNVEALDLDAGAPGMRLPGSHLSTTCRDSGRLVRTGYLVTRPRLGRADWTIGNPPFGVPRPCTDCTPPGQLVGPGCERCKGQGTRGTVPVAELHVRRALELSRNVVFLLRLNFLGARERLGFWRSTPLRQVAILVPRPSFSRVCIECGGTGVGAAGPCHACDDGKVHGASGSDSTEYGAFWWDHDWRGPATLGHLVWRS